MQKFEIDFCVGSVGHYTLTIYPIIYSSGVILACGIGSIYNINMSTLPNSLEAVGLDVVSCLDVMSRMPAGSVQGGYSLIRRQMVLDWLRHTFILKNSFWVCKLWFNITLFD